jgi:hypothetical protein
VDANTQVPTVVTHSWNALDPAELNSCYPVWLPSYAPASKIFALPRDRSIACPMGATDTPDDPLIVLTENRGTCSTKHALIRRLAMEQDLDIALVLGMYEMTEQNTPGIGNVLRKYGLATLPEAHCHLRTSGKRIDLTRDIGRRGRGEEIVGFLYKEDIDLNQITH